MTVGCNDESLAVLKLQANLTWICVEICHRYRLSPLFVVALAPAHGTNPATAGMCGYKVYEVPTGPDGDVDIDELKKVVGPKTAGIMLTNPSTLGVFERKITEIADMRM